MRAKPKCSKIYLKVFDDEKQIDRVIFVPCKQWDCPVCGKKNEKRLRWELKEAIKALFQGVQEEGGYLKHCFKMLRLSVPGRDYRNAWESGRDWYEGKVSITEAYEALKKHWNKLRTALVKKYGSFDYVAVVEPHKDSYPHMHVLLIGEAIAPKSILADIRNLWVKKYKMGEIDLQEIKHGLSGAVNYVLKYITKTGRKQKRFTLGNQRLFSTSQRISEMRKSIKKKKEKTLTVYEIGICNHNSDGTTDMISFWRATDYSDTIEIQPEDLEKNFDELMEFFSEVTLKENLIKHIQRHQALLFDDVGNDTTPI